MLERLNKQLHILPEAGQIGTNPVIRLFSAVIVFKIVNIYLVPTVCQAQWGDFICAFNTTAILRREFFYPHMTEEQTEALKSEGMCPKPHHYQGPESTSRQAPPCLFSEPPSPL